MATRLLFSKPQTVAYEQADLADPGPGQATARSVLSGISHGTELTGFLGKSPFVDRTLTPERTFRDRTPDDAPFFPFYWAGYDLVGVVEKVGQDVSGLKPGDRVWSGIPHQTEFLFNATDGSAVRLPDSVPTEEAIVLNLVSIGYNAVLDAEIKLGDVVVVSGGGLLGQVIVQMAYLSGARQVYLLEPIRERREFAAGRSSVICLDPSTCSPAAEVARDNGALPDVVIECSGSVKGLAGAIRVAGVAGRVVAAGFYAGSAAALELGEEFLHNRVSVRASMSVWDCPARFAPRWSRERLVQESVGLLARRKLDLGGVISARYPFEQAQEAYEAIRDHPERYLKVVLEYPG